MKRKNEIDEIIYGCYQEVQETLGTSEIIFDSMTEEEIKKVLAKEYEIFKAGFLMANMPLK